MAGKYFGREFLDRVRAGDVPGLTADPNNPALAYDAMDICAAAGTRVRFTGYGGYECHQEHSRKFLTAGCIYTVDRTDVGGGHTNVFLKEFPGEGFNSVMFAAAGGRQVSRRPGDPGYAAGWCVHYRYNREPKIEAEDTCEAGVRFSEFGDTKFAQRPCFLDSTGRSKPGAVSCEKLRRPTAEEIKLHLAWCERRKNLLVTVMTGIQPWLAAHRGQSASDVVACPACGGRLHISVVRSNGHTYGHCETPDCASWMQ